MTIQYSTLLGLTKPDTGTQSGTWGDDINEGLTDFLDGAIAGAQIISGSATAVTLSKTVGTSTDTTPLVQVGSGSSGSSQYQIIRCTGNPASLLTITAPAADKTYVVINATSTNQSVKIVGSGPTTGVTVISGEKALVVWNGSDFVKAGGVTGGSNTQVQYNNGGVLGGIANATSDGTTLSMTSPKVITGINDTNGNELLKVTATGSAVNELTLANAATGDAPTLSATGNDTNIGINITPKGSGTVTISKLSSTNITSTYVDTASIRANDGTAAITIENVTGRVYVSSELYADNLILSGNTIFSLNTNGNIELDPNGTGVVKTYSAVLADTDIKIWHGPGADPSSTVLGKNALPSSSGLANTVIGTNALSSLLGAATSGNTVIGTDALKTVTGYATTNVVIGYTADQDAEYVYDGTYNYAPLRNVTIGALAGIYSGVKQNSITIGYAAGAFTKNANSNIAIGSSALPYSQSLSRNTAVGHTALLNLNGATVSASSLVAGQTYMILSVGTSDFTTAGAYSNTVNLTFTATGPVSGGGTGTAMLVVDSLTTAVGYASGSQITTGIKNTILGPFTGNQGGLDIRTANSYVVLSDGDGNPRWISDNNSAAGYGPTTGGAVTQTTSRTTGVTLNKPTGAITLVSAAGTTSWQTFTVTNSTITVKDTVIVSQKSGTDLYQIFVTAVAAGSFNITFATTGGTTTEQPVFNFAVIKGQTT